jgi:hypothetical protein
VVEQNWTKKLVKIYRAMKFLEGQKESGGFFSNHLKGL